MHVSWHKNTKNLVAAPSAPRMSGETNVEGDHPFVQRLVSDAPAVECNYYISTFQFDGLVQLGEAPRALEMGNRRDHFLLVAADGPASISKPTAQTQMGPIRGQPTTRTKA
jgi:hypothetical protein